MIYLTYLYYKKNYFELYSLLIWLAIFSSFIFFTLFPDLLSPFAEVLKVARLFDLFAAIGIMLLISLTYTNFISIQGLKKKLEKLIQNSALENETKEKKNLPPQ